MVVGPVFMKVAIPAESPIEVLAEELRGILNAAPRNREPFPAKQERDGMNHNGEYWLFGLLDVEVVLMHGDDPAFHEIYIGTTDHGFGEPLAAKLARILFSRGYKVSLTN